MNCLVPILPAQSGSDIRRDKVMAVTLLVSLWPTSLVYGMDDLVDKLEIKWNETPQRVGQ